MAVAVVLRGRNRDRVLQAPFLQVLRDLRRIQLRLLAGLDERVDRSIATPKEIIDMITRMTPMPLAIGPICPHISIRFIRPVPFRN
jgi:hypothetical protein